MNGTRETIERWNAAGERLLRELNETPNGKVTLWVKAVLRRDLARQRRRLACLDQHEGCTGPAGPAARSLQPHAALLGRGLTCQ
jgi:hypothetical protein